MRLPSRLLSSFFCQEECEQVSFQSNVLLCQKQHGRSLVQYCERPKLNQKLNFSGKDSKEQVLTEVLIKIVLHFRVFNTSFIRQVSVCLTGHQYALSSS